MRKITMTRNFHSLAGVIALGLMTLSCTGNYLDINTNPYEVNREQDITPRQVHSKRPLTITMRQTTGREYCSQVTGLSLHFTPTFRSSRA